MQLSSLFFAVVAAVSVFAQAPDPSINTPTGVQQCLPVQLTFSGTSPPFVITVVPGGQAGASPLTTVGTTSADAITWTANLPVGAQYTLVIRDSLGRTNPSGEFTINAGTDASCLNSSAAAGSTAAGASSAAPASTSAAAVTTSEAVVTTTTAVASGSSSAVVTTHATSATVISSAAASSTKNAAPTMQPLGVAGLVGLAGVAALL